MRLLVCALLLLAILAGCSSDPETIVNEQLALATEAVEQYQFGQAVEAVLAIGEVDPGHYTLPYIEGLVWEQKAQYLDALSAYAQATQVKPDFAPAYAGMYRAFARLGGDIEAAEAAASLTSLKSDDAEAQFILAEAYLDLSQYARVRSAVGEAVSKGLPDGTASMMIALSFLKQQQFDSAATHYDRGRANPDETAWFWKLTADYAESVGQIDSAIGFSERAVVVSDDDVYRMSEHVERSLRHDYHLAARRAIERLSNIDSSQAARDQWYVAYWADAGRMSLARNGRVRQAFSTGTTINSLYQGLRALPKYETGQVVIEDVMTIRSRVRTEGWPEPLVAFVDYLLAVHLKFQMVEKESLEALKAVRAPRSNSIAVKSGLPLQQKRVGLDEEADQGIDILIQYHQGQPDWLTTVADVLCEHAFRQWDRAAGLYEEALGLDSLYRPAVDGYIDMLVKNEEYGTALAILKKYSQFPRRYPIYEVRRAELLVRTGKTQAGLDLFATSIAPLWQRIPLWASLAEALDRQGATEQLEQLVELAQQMAQDNPDLLVLTAKLLSDLGHFDRAQETAKVALTHEPENVDVRTELARALYKLGDREAAYEFLAENVKMDATNPRSAFWYSRFLASEESQLDLAMNIARKAMLESPLDVEAWCNLSYVYYQAGRLQLAYGEARNAAKQHPKHPLPYFRRGMAEFMLDKKEAKTTLEKSIQLGLAGEPLRQARETIAQQ